MPLLQIETTSSSAHWALWHITEDETELSKALGKDGIPADIVHPLKRLEYAAGRLLTQGILKHLKMQFHGIQKDSYGKPLLTDLAANISLSHSFPYVAVIIDGQRSPGIDIEQPKPKLLRIASRIMNKAEQADAADNVIKHCVYWCGKETLMKVHGKRDVSFSGQLNVHPFKIAEKGHLRGSILADGITKEVEMEYRLFSGFVVVHTN